MGKYIKIEKQNKYRIQKDYAEIIIQSKKYGIFYAKIDLEDMGEQLVAKTIELGNEWAKCIEHYGWIEFQDWLVAHIVELEGKLKDANDMLDEFVYAESNGEKYPPAIDDR